jgi:hypothetical protein
MDRHPSWLEKLNSRPPVFQPTWKSNRKANVFKRRLAYVHGKVDLIDRIERISVARLMDILEIPRGLRNARVYMQVSAAMAELGWEKVNAPYGMTEGPKHRARGFIRKPTR